MNTTTTEQVAPTAATKTGSPWLAAISAAIIGLAVITAAGHLQADVLHDAAHDVRHATGFPCH